MVLKFRQTLYDSIGLEPYNTIERKQGVSVRWIAHNDVHLVHTAGSCRKVGRKNVRTGSQGVHEHRQPRFVHSGFLSDDR